MTFTSIEFILFFIIVVPLYFVSPYRWRLFLLLVASYYFYAFWEANYLILIIFSTVVDYVVGRRLGQVDPAQTRQRQFLLAASVVVNLGVLFIFKYFNFFSDSIAATLTALSIPFDQPTLRVLLPVGISFYTFQSMSYTIDVYRRQIEPEPDFVRFATFVAFFPQLVAGPIERASNMLPQFKQKFAFDYANAVLGLRQILWGAFKKIVIADRLAPYVNAVYANPQSYDGTALIIATVFFAFQIYCDFSAYSDIAIGTARMMGFNLMENFRQPYFSLSVREFWQRWHISLSTWFRDYLYIPLGGNRVSFSRNLLNLLIVFVVSGLWHGASWTFVIWGALHGIYVVVESILRRYDIHLLPQALPPVMAAGIRMIVTFILTNIAWVFFRADSLDTALYITTHFFDPTGDLNWLHPYQGLSPLGATYEFLTSLAVISILLFVDGLQARIGLDAVLNRLALPIRWGIYYVLAAMVIGVSIIYYQAAGDFIYFQF